MIIKLKSGTEIYANHGIIGITPANETIDGCRLTEGYDSPISTVGYDGDEPKPIYTSNELIEICNIMIARWMTYRDGCMKG